VNLQAVSIGEDAPAEVNVVIEVPIGGERSSTKWTRRAAR
jgi:hypothetical protein